LEDGVSSVEMRQWDETSCYKWNCETWQIQIDTLLDLQKLQNREAEVSGNCKIVEEIVGKIYSCEVYNVGEHARHISEEVVTKISETHNI
jgi:hypothetical protein